MSVFVQQGLSASGGGGPTLDTEQATTSGTTKDFTIPAGAKRITIMLNGVSTSGTSDIGIQLGDAGGIEATGYIGGSQSTGGASTTQFMVTGTNGAATDTFYGAVTLYRMNTTHTWVLSGVLWEEATGQDVVTPVGRKTLSDELTTVRLMGGTFDAGAVNVMYE